MGYSQRARVAVGASVCLAGLVIAFVGPPVATFFLLPDVTPATIDNVQSNVSELDNAGNTALLLLIAGLCIAALGLLLCMITILVSRIAECVTKQYPITVGCLATGL